MPNVFSLYSMVAVSMLLVACAPAKPLVNQDVSKKHLQVNSSAGDEAAPIPAIKQKAPFLPKPKLSGNGNLYNLSVIQAPIRDVLFKLARDAKLELNIVDDVMGTVTINLIDQPLSVIIERLNDQANIRASLEGRLLTVQADVPYWHNYPIDYVNLDRYTSSSILMANAIGSDVQSTSSVQLGTPLTQQEPAGNLQAGSNVAILNRARNEVWNTLHQGVMQILRSYHPELAPALKPGESASNRSGSRAEAKQATLSRQNIEATDSEAGVTAAVEGALEDKLNNTMALPMEEDLVGYAVSGNVYPEGESVSSYVSLAREAGFVAVYANRKVHTQVQKYIDDLTQGTRRQVMIEATIVEVTLNDENQAGINWNAFTKGFSLGTTFSSSSDVAQRAGTTTLISNGRADKWNIDTTLNLLQRYGNSQVLSSPKIVGINNQQTLLKVVKNLVYFTTTVTPGQTTATGTTQTVFSTTPNTIPVGLIMSVLPSIDQNDQVTLVVRPTISNVVRFVEDPNPEFKKQDLGIVSLIPEIQEREMESVLKLNDGQIAILGGLIQDEISAEDTGIPGAVTDPTFGYLFGQKNKAKSKSELVIFLRPTIIKHPDIEQGDFANQREYLERYTTPQPYLEP